GLALLPGCARLRPVTRRDPHAGFFSAVQRGDQARVATLLDGRPSLVEARDPDGRSALTVALLAGHPAVADLVRARGYEPDLIESAWVGDWARFDALADAHGPARHAAVNAPHPLGGAAMYAAARGGQGAAMWRVFAQCGLANPPAQPPATFTPLRAAFEVAELGAAEMTAATLLANGADPNAREPGASSALHAAAARGSLALVEMLIRKGARVEARDDGGHSAHALAERGGHATVAELLARHHSVPRDHHALRRAYDVHGRAYRPPPLTDVPILAQNRFVGLGHAQFDELRRQLDAEPRLVHALATTTEMAVDAASHTGRRDIADYLLARGAPYPMATAVLRGNRAEVAALFDRAPARIHERGPHDFALLWYPVLGGGDLEMAELLLERGADIDTQHFMGTTALHWAAKAGQRDMVALLTERGAEVDRVGRKFDAGGQTPRQLALAGGHREVARLLEERGARTG
ncbi:ankyrin repeat domain-containing protein, partial [Haliangium sp.]|uniref:ankyrin repeat domain-containing protein n=1 Tax=Haliangium sp. TaxID=2663208 RepID=UPI003D0F652F